MSDVNITANYTAQQLTRTERLSSQIRACGRHKQHIALLSQVSFSHHDKLHNAVHSRREYCASFTNLITNRDN